MLVPEIVLYIARVAVNLSLQIDIFLVLGCIKSEKITKLFQKIGENTSTNSSLIGLIFRIQEKNTITCNPI